MVGKFEERLILVFFIVLVARNARCVIDPYNDSPPEPRIIRGREAMPHSYPYTAAIVIKQKNFCAGTLLSRNYVLSAAHCILDDISDMMVILGAHNIFKPEDTQHKTLVAEVKKHEKYNSTSFQYDLALLVLVNRPPFKPGVIYPARLPSRSEVSKEYLSEIFTAVGWGLTKDKSAMTIMDISPVLKLVDAQVFPISQCKYYFNHRRNITFITDFNICTTGQKNQGTCKGDSGGPLIYKSTLVGVVSIGTTLCEMCTPSIYTRVDKFLDWIELNSDVVILD